ncbi:hypothetical protein [Glutamicibacter sp. TV12E]|uniref:hypothetical protein n=1 Tax=Glutamicibacter sp. TV12E TaxID=3446362 RepID=UPI004033CB5C
MSVGYACSQLQLGDQTRSSSTMISRQASSCAWSSTETLASSLYGSASPRPMNF